METSAGYTNPWAGRMLSVLRIVSALMFMQHGTQKLFNFPPSEKGPMPFNPMSQMGIGGILEAFGGLLLLLGLFTRPVAFVLSGMMAYAYWFMHAFKAGSMFPVVNKGELAALYCFVFLFFVFSGPGPWSLDRLMKRGSR